MTTKKEVNSLSGIVSTGKDLVEMLRDGMLFLLLALLIIWPQAINSILVEAGFEEGSISGFKWRKKLEKSDETLLETQATIADLREQNSRLSRVLAKVKTRIASPQESADILELSELNTRIAENSAKVQAAAESTTTANAPLVQKAQASTGTVVTWGVVYGGDRTLDSAKYEVYTIAPKLGLTNSAIYYRNNSFRSVATTTDRLQAEKLLKKAKEHRKDSYIVNMSSWCPRTNARNGYFECLNS